MENFIFCAVDVILVGTRSTDPVHYFHPELPQPAFTCSKLTMETLEPGVKYVQS